MTAVWVLVGFVVYAAGWVWVTRYVARAALEDDPERDLTDSQRFGSAFVAVFWPVWVPVVAVCMVVARLVRLVTAGITSGAAERRRIHDAEREAGVGDGQATAEFVDRVAAEIEPTPQPVLRPKDWGDAARVALAAAAAMSPDARRLAFHAVETAPKSADPYMLAALDEIHRLLSSGVDKGAYRAAASANGFISWQSPRPPDCGFTGG